MIRVLVSFLAIVFSAIVFSSGGAHAELRVDVTKGTMDPIPVAITQFVPKDESNNEFASDITKVMS